MSNSNARYYSQPTRAMLWANSGGICCFPECEETCVDETEGGNTITTGEIAHIEAKGDNGPRANPSLSDQQRDAYSNLIVLCRNHHRRVDADESTYTVEMLRKWKADQARIVKSALRQGRQNTNSVQLMDEIPQSVSDPNLEEREKALHRETRDAIVGKISPEIAKLNSLIADAMDIHSLPSSKAASDPQHIELSAKIDVARNFIDRGLVKAARLELEQLNKDNEGMPDDIKFRVITNLGACALAEGDFEAASARLYEAYELQPDSQKGMTNAALAAQLDDDSERAMELASKARELEPKDSQATAILLRELWNTDEANRFEELVATEEWITKDKQCALVIAGIRLQQQRFDEAVSLCRSAIKIDAEYAYAHLTLSECLLLQSQSEIRTLGFTDAPIGKLREAVETATKALESLPIDLEAQRLTALAVRGCAYAILGEMDDALRDLNCASAGYSPQLDATNFNKGLVLLQVGRPTEARAAFEEIQDTEYGAETVLPLAKACLDVNDASAASNLLKGSFSLEKPAWDDVFKAVALVLAEQAMDNQDSVGPTLTSALEKHPNDPRLLMLSSIHYSILGHSEDAEGLLVQALGHASSSDRGMILAELSKLYMNLGRFSEAADTYSEIVGGVAAHPDAFALLYCLAKSNRLRETLNWSRTVRQSHTETPRLVIETEAHVLEQVGDIPATIPLLEELCSRDDATSTDKVNLAMAQLRCGERNAALETIRDIDTLELKEYPETICILAKMKLALGAPDFLDDAYLALRCGFNDPKIHLDYYALFLSRDKDVAEPDSVDQGCAVLLKDESEQWWYILDEDEEPRSPYELHPGSELAQCLIGRRTGEIVNLRSGLEDLSYEIVGIQSKFVRAVQETTGEFSTRFPSDTSLSRIKVEDNDVTNVLSLVNQRDSFVQTAERAYTEGNLPLSTFASLIGRSTLEVWRDCAKAGAAHVRFGNGSEEEIRMSLPSIQDAHSVVLDMTALLTMYELGLAEYLRSRFVQVSVPQHVMDELRETSFVARNVVPSGYLGKDIDGGYIASEVSDQEWLEWRSYVQSVLEFAKSFNVIPAYRLLEADDPTILVETLTHAGVGAIFADDEQPAPGQALISDDLALSRVARSFGIDAVNTQALLHELLRAGTITDEKYSACIEKLVLLNYWFVRVGPDDIVRRLAANSYMTSEGFWAMLKTLEDPDCLENSAVRVGAGVIVGLAGNAPFQQVELILPAVMSALKQGRVGDLVLRRFRNEVTGRLAGTPHLRLQILQFIDIYIQVFGR